VCVCVRNGRTGRILVDLRGERTAGSASAGLKEWE
jgi:hypothetical protein